MYMFACWRAGGSACVRADVRAGVHACGRAGGRAGVHACVCACVRTCGRGGRAGDRVHEFMNIYSAVVHFSPRASEPLPGQHRCVNCRISVGKR